MSEPLKTAADAISRFANMGGGRWEAQELAETMASDHRTLVQIETDVFIRFLRKLADNYDHGYYDERNEAACKRAKVMVDALNAAGYDHDGLPFV